MTTLQDIRQSVSRFVDGARKRRQLRLELAQLAAMGDLDTVLADVGLARSQIEPLIEGCAGARELLDRMLARLGIDAGQLTIEDLRDMTWTCTTCPDKHKCREWLAEAEETGDFRSFCPNAAHLDDAMAAVGCSHPSRPAAGDGAYRPTGDELRRMRAEAGQRETRVLLDRANLI